MQRDDTCDCSVACGCCCTMCTVTCSHITSVTDVSENILPCAAHGHASKGRHVVAVASWLPPCTAASSAGQSRAGQCFHVKGALSTSSCCSCTSDGCLSCITVSCCCAVVLHRSCVCPSLSRGAGRWPWAGLASRMSGCTGRSGEAHAACPGAIKGPRQNS